jgi:hypothetical protein
VFSVEMLPAQDGDCLWVEWGEEDNLHRMLIDAGRADGQRPPAELLARIEALAPRDRTFDLVVATHMDADHVHGLVPLFADPPDRFVAREVWFNGFGHLPRPPGDDTLGYRDADRLAAALDAQAGPAWNRGWTDSPNGAVVVPDARTALPRRTIAGLEITLVSPTLDTLAKLRTLWPESVRSAGLDPAVSGKVRGDLLGRKPRDLGTPLHDLATLNDDPADPSVSNRSSIAFLATHDGRTVLFGADAHADVLAAGLARVDGGRPVHVDVCKVPHHGSRQNVKPELLRMLDCDMWLISTNGGRHNHPDRRAMARILTTGERQALVFNYESEMNEEYGGYVVKNEFRNAAHYPVRNDSGIRVDVAAAPPAVT